jgi:phasin family protein
MGANQVIARQRQNIGPLPEADVPIVEFTHSSLAREPSNVVVDLLWHCNNQRLASKVSLINPIAQEAPEMLEPMQKASEDLEELGNDNYDVMVRSHGYEMIVRSYGELNKTFQTIAERWTDFSKQSLEEAIRAWQQMISAKSPEQLLQIQNDYAKKSYDDWMAEMTKLGQMYSSAAHDAQNPVEQAVPEKDT